jgi:hypothetical protein
MFLVVGGQRVKGASKKAKKMNILLTGRCEKYFFGLIAQQKGEKTLLAFLLLPNSATENMENIVADQT